MRPGAFTFTEKWIETVKGLGESGMGYTVVTITLADGRIFPQTLINGGTLSRVRNYANVPFCEDEIVNIKQTDEKWDWSETP